MARRVIWVLAVAWFSLVLWQKPSLAQTDQRCPEPVAEVVSGQGKIEIREAGTGLSQPAELRTLICPGDLIAVGDRSRAALVLLNSGAILRIDQNTTLRILEPIEKGVSLVDLLIGAINFLSSTPRSLEVRTPFVNAGVRGTEFMVRVGREQTFITVFEGTVAIENAFGRQTVTDGQSAVARADAAPESRIIVRPRDSVQWALLCEKAPPPNANVKRGMLVRY